MRYTNNHDLPTPIVNAVTRDRYSKGESDFSVSEIIDSPRIKALMIEHDNELEEDVADRVFSLFGSAVHQILEWGAEDHQSAEERLFLEVEIDGVSVVVSGAMDLQDPGGDAIAIRDWKVTTVWAFQAEKEDWVRQLNCYAHLVRNAQRAKRKLDGKWVMCEHTPKEVSGIQIGAILRDFAKSKAKRDPSYPPAAIQTLDLPLWPADQAKAYFNDRVARHIRARDLVFAGQEPVECTAEERWEDAPSFAVMKGENKRASTIVPTREEAIAFIEGVQNKGMTYVIEERGSTPKRCVDWCAVANFCKQNQRRLQQENNT